MRQCPKCDNWTVDFDDYFGRFRCFDAECGWMPLSAAEREIRLLRSHKEPARLDSFEIPDLGLTLTPCYDPENDALSVDFGSDEATFDLPEPDGRLIWRIGRRSDSIAGFTILGVREGAISKVTIEFIVKRKQDIEKKLRRIPGIGAIGRATRDLIEQVVVTAESDAAAEEHHSAMESAWMDVVNKVEKMAHA
ncbi:hypothetical protein LCGC14_1613550 [marine sediment metagenome]|uniref:Uncharacterized protein n=1 Tax=marine sediment metagenome TaxID=412755 RepID=A0A0F9I7K7_9ZZZZ